MGEAWTGARRNTSSGGSGRRRKIVGAVTVGFVSSNIINSLTTTHAALVKGGGRGGVASQPFKLRLPRIRASLIDNFVSKESHESCSVKAMLVSQLGIALFVAAVARQRQPQRRGRDKGRRGSSAGVCAFPLRRLFQSKRLISCTVRHCEIETRANVSD